MMEPQDVHTGSNALDIILKGGVGVFAAWLIIKWLISFVTLLFTKLDERAIASQKRCDDERTMLGARIALLEKDERHDRERRDAETSKRELALLEVAKLTARALDRITDIETDVHKALEVKKGHDEHPDA